MNIEQNRLMETPSLPLYSIVFLFSSTMKLNTIPFFVILEPKGRIGKLNCRCDESLLALAHENSPSTYLEAASCILKVKKETAPQTIAINFSLRIYGIINYATIATRTLIERKYKQNKSQVTRFNCKCQNDRVCTVIWHTAETYRTFDSNVRCIIILIRTISPQCSYITLARSQGKRKTIFCRQCTYLT